jgi:hypothetical protein
MQWNNLYSSGITTDRYGKYCAKQELDLTMPSDITLLTDASYLERGNSELKTGDIPGFLAMILHRCTLQDLPHKILQLLGASQHILPVGLQSQRMRVRRDCFQTF